MTLVGEHISHVRNVYLEIMISYVQRIRHKPDGLITIKRGRFVPKLHCALSSLSLDWGSKPGLDDP